MALNKPSVNVSVFHLEEIAGKNFPKLAIPIHQVCLFGLSKKKFYTEMKSTFLHGLN